MSVLYNLKTCKRSSQGLSYPHIRSCIKSKQVTYQQKKQTYKTFNMHLKKKNQSQRLNSGHRIILEFKKVKQRKKSYLLDITFTSTNMEQSPSSIIPIYTRSQRPPPRKAPTSRTHLLLWHTSQEKSTKVISSKPICTYIWEQS